MLRNVKPAFYVNTLIYPVASSNQSFVCHQWKWWGTLPHPDFWFDSYQLVDAWFWLTFIQVKVTGQKSLASTHTVNEHTAIMYTKYGHKNIQPQIQETTVHTVYSSPTWLLSFLYMYSLHSGISWRDWVDVNVYCLLSISLDCLSVPLWY